MDSTGSVDGASAGNLLRRAQRGIPSRDPHTGRSYPESRTGGGRQVSGAGSRSRAAPQTVRSGERCVPSAEHEPSTGDTTARTPLSRRDGPRAVVTPSGTRLGLV